MPKEKNYIDNLEVNDEEDIEDGDEFDISSLNCKKYSDN